MCRSTPPKHSTSGCNRKSVGSNACQSCRRMPMAKANKTGRSKGDARHARVYEHMQDSEAWKCLSPLAVKAYLRICLVYNCSNNGRLGVSARWLADKMGISYPSAARAIKELVHHGFLDCLKGSSFSLKRAAAEYRLTHFHCDKTNTSASKRYLRFGQSNIVSIHRTDEN